MMAVADIPGCILDCATHTAIVVTDFDGRIALFNRGATNLFGYTPEEALTRNVQEITFSPEDQKGRLFEETVTRLKNEGWTEERWFRQHTSGRLFPAISTLTCLKDATGVREGILEITQDVPGIYRLERELKSSKDFLENILASSIDAVVTTDTKGYITYANRAFKELVGLRGHQIIGKHISIYYEDGIDQARRIMGQLRQSGRIRDYEFNMKSGDRIIPIRTSDSLLYDDNGDIVGTMGVFQDITARKKLSEKLSATQAELIQAVKIRALGDLVTGVAHEINNPLMASKTVLHVLEAEIKDHPAWKKRITLLKECNKRIEKIVTELKAFSRQATLEFTAMDVNDAVSSVLAITGQQLLNQCIEVKLRLREDLPPVLGDKNQIEQVLLNLIANAQDAMEESDHKILTIQTSLRRKGQQIMIRVSDTGTGMAAEQIEQIFNPFFTTKESERSIGLGLSISYRIVEDHQGKIGVQSELNRGTVFTVTLPVYLGGSERCETSRKVRGKDASENSGGG